MVMTVRVTGILLASLQFIAIIYFTLKLYVLQDWNEVKMDQEFLLKLTGMTAKNVAVAETEEKLEDPPVEELDVAKTQEDEPPSTNQSQRLPRQKHGHQAKLLEMMENLVNELDDENLEKTTSKEFVPKEMPTVTPKSREARTPLKTNSVFAYETD